MLSLQENITSAKARSSWMASAFGLRLTHLGAGVEIEDKVLAKTKNALKAVEQYFDAQDIFLTRGLSSQPDKTSKTLISEYWDLNTQYIGEGQLKPTSLTDAKIDIRLRYEIDEQDNRITGTSDLSLKIQYGSINKREELEIEASELTAKSFSDLIEKYKAIDLKYAELIVDALGEEILNNPQDVLEIKCTNACERVFAPVRVYFKKEKARRAWRKVSSIFNEVPYQPKAYFFHELKDLNEFKTDGVFDQDKAMRGTTQLTFDMAFDHSNYWDGKRKIGEDFEIEAELRIKKSRYDKNHLSDPSALQSMIAPALQKIRDTMKKAGNGKINFAATAISKASRGMALLPPRTRVFPDIVPQERYPKLSS